MKIHLGLASGNKVRIAYVVNGMCFRTQTWAKLAAANAPATWLPNGKSVIVYILTDPHSATLVGTYSDPALALFHQEWELCDKGTLRHGDDYIQPDAEGNFHTPAGIFATLEDAYDDH